MGSLAWISSGLDWPQHEGGGGGRKLGACAPDGRLLVDDEVRGALLPLPVLLPVPRLPLVLQQALPGGMSWQSVRHHMQSLWRR